MKEENFVSVICYYNGKYDNKVDFITYISNFINKNFKKFEIIIVCDDANSHKKKELSNLIKAKKLDTQISIIYLEHYFGKEKSLSAAMDLAIGDYIIEFNDINYRIPEEKIMNIYKECRNGYDTCVLVQNKISIMDKLYYYIIKKFSYVKYSEYREDGIMSVISRRMINRITSLKKQVTNKWFFYKMSGLPCKYIKNETNKTIEYSYSEKLKERLNTIFVFTSFVIRIYTFISILLLILSLILIIKFDLYFGILCMILSIINLGIDYLMKKQALNLEYLWSDSKYQYSSMEKISKE